MHKQEKTIFKLRDLANCVSPTKPTTRSTLFTKAIQGAAKHKYKASELKQQLELIATALLEGAKMKKGKKGEEFCNIFDYSLLGN
ncbi:hypothetical protein DSO57_1019875 [Entomophthora muscae]|uniref:Uncharacterized protein n=1 Tax=Entomophthora muscae TaxID=34485 RepID=A0ACC2T3Z5_9FUNG|nr:hypothetical protein DSO57_1019875 [Entomophthora muscae]